MNDQENLKEVFDLNSSKTKAMLRRAKLVTLIRTVTISALVFILLSAAILVANARLLNRIGADRFLEEYLIGLVARPNTYITHARFSDGFLVGELEYVCYRIVGDRPVYDGTHRVAYGLIPFVKSVYGAGRAQLIQIENERSAYGVEFAYYNKLGHREMRFFHPHVGYETYPNDLALLEQMGEDKYVEVAISFDQRYSLEEVHAMLPGGARLVWYWVDTYDEQDLSRMKAQYSDDTKQYGEASVLFASQVYGIKAISSSGEELEEPWNQFLAAVNSNANIKSRYQDVFRRLFEVLGNGKEEVTEEDIRVIGVVVTGDTQSMLLLRDIGCIKAATLGVVIGKL